MANIIFDLDGVLIHSRRLDGTFLWSATIERELSIPSGVKQQLFKQPEWGEMLCGRGDFRSYLNRIVIQSELGCTADQIIEYWLNQDLSWNFDVLDLARDLKEAGHKLYIASNQDQLRTDFIRTQREISADFEGLFTSAEIGSKKPDRKFFETVRKEVQETDDEICLMIDDSGQNVDVAISIGMRGIRFDPDLEVRHTAKWLSSQIESCLSNTPLVPGIR